MLSISSLQTWVESLFYGDVSGHFQHWEVVQSLLAPHYNLYTCDLSTLEQAQRLEHKHPHQFESSKIINNLECGHVAEYFLRIAVISKILRKKWGLQRIAAYLKHVCQCCTFEETRGSAQFLISALKFTAHFITNLIQQQIKFNLLIIFLFFSSLTNSPSLWNGLKCQCSFLSIFPQFAQAGPEGLQPEDKWNCWLLISLIAFRFSSFAICFSSGI